MQNRWALNAATALRVTGAVYAAAIIAHGADHLRRGLDAVTPEVFWAGIAGAFLAGIAIAAALVAGRSAGALAVVVGLPSALGIAAVHLLPGWGPCSDSFWKPGTAAASWAARKSGSP